MDLIRIISPILWLHPIINLCRHLLIRVGEPPLVGQGKGKPGNLRGAGSRLQVIRKNGTSEVIDLNLGVGYLTGNEPQAWVSQRIG